MPANFVEQIILIACTGYQCLHAACRRTHANARQRGHDRGGEGLLRVLRRPQGSFRSRVHARKRLNRRSAAQRRRRRALAQRVIDCRVRCHAVQRKVSAE